MDFFPILADATISENSTVTIGVIILAATVGLGVFVGAIWQAAVMNTKLDNLLNILSGLKEDNSASKSLLDDHEKRITILETRERDRE